MIIEPINVDCLSDDPKDYEEAYLILSLYAQYCSTKAQIMRFRLGGYIASAERCEQELDRIYSLLPAGAAW